MIIPNTSKEVWVTMITPFTPKGEIDFAAVERLVEWYIANGVDGIFAVCQSSEMFFLTYEERLLLAERVIRTAAGRVGVVVSGNVEDDMERQLYEAHGFARLNPDAVVFLTNRSDGDLSGALRRIACEMPPETSLGLYECPYPFKRLLTDGEVAEICAGGRFSFIKDTACDIEILRGRAKIANGTALGMYNANSQTLLDSLKLGYDGFCGVMANFHPDLYAWLVRNPSDERAPRVSAELGEMSRIESLGYPCCAKLYLSEYEGLSIHPGCRNPAGSRHIGIEDALREIRRRTLALRELIAAAHML